MSEQLIELNKNIGGGAGGYLEDLKDVNITNISNGDIISYDSTNQEYINQPKSLYPQSVELTKAEYDALVASDQDDPTTEYFITDIETASTDYIETSIITAVTGTTTLTFTNTYITPTCRPRIFAQPISCKTAGSTQYKVKAKISTITNGSCTITFPALIENTEFKLLINAPEVSNPADNYSTEEVFTGKLWINGEKIYRKVVEGTSPSEVSTNGTIATVGTDISIINMQGNIILSSLARIPINFYQSAAIWVGTYTSQGNITMQVGHTNYTNKPVNIIVEYIKISS